MSKYTIFIAAFFLLPAFDPLLFGWLSGITGVLVFFFLYTKGQQQGALLLRNGFLTAAAVLVLSGKVEMLLFSMIFIPLGYTIFKSSTTGHCVTRAGTRGVVTLGLSWLLYCIIQGVLASENPYVQLLTLLDAGLAEMISIYSQQADLPIETGYALTVATEEFRRILPVVLPGILGSVILTTVWSNLIISNALIRKIQPSVELWGKYKTWTLPDQTVWIPICAAVIMLIADNGLQTIAVTVFITASLLFSFQGLAVFIHLLDRWKVPTVLRLLIFGMLIIQSYGLLLLAVLGISEVWLNIRGRAPEES